MLLRTFYPRSTRFKLFCRLGQIMRYADRKNPSLSPFMNRISNCLAYLGWIVLGAFAGVAIGLLAGSVTFSVLTSAVLNSSGAERVEWELYQEECARIAFFIGMISTLLLSLIPSKSIRKLILCFAYLSLVVIVAQVFFVLLRYWPLLF